MSLFDSSLYEWNPYAWPYAVAGVLTLAQALFVLYKQPRSLFHRAFCCATLAVSVWLIGFVFMYCSRRVDTAMAWTAIIFMAISFISINIYLFVLALLNKVRQRRTALIVGYIVATAFALLQLNDYFIHNLMTTGMYSYFWSYYAKWGPAEIPYLVFFFGYMTASFVELIRAHAHERDTRRRNQIRWVLLAYIIAYLGSVDFLPNFGIEIYTVGWAPILLFVSMITYAVIRHRLMDIQTAIHKTFLWAVLSSLIFLPILAILLLTRDWLDTLPTWGVALFSMTVFYLLTVYTRTIQPKIDHLFERRKYDLQQVFDQLLQRLALLGDLRPLGRLITQTLRDTLYARHATLLVMDETGHRYRALEANAQPDVLIAADDAALDWIRQQPGVVESDTLDQLPGMEEQRRAVQALFSRTGIVVCVPLSTGHEFVGLLLLGPKTNLKPYAALDLHLLDKLRTQAAIALANASLYERIVRLNAELSTLNDQLEARVTRRTAELEAANQQLTDSNRQIAQADRAKTQFLANISHELRTPLNAIIGFSKLLLKEIDGPVTPKQREDLTAVLHSGTHLLGLISDLLDLSKIEAGKMELTTAAVELDQLIRGVLTTAQALIKDKPLELRAHLAGQLPTIAGDPIRIRQVLLNLLSNAVKFTDRGDVEVRAERRGRYVVVSVQDTGCGIPPEEQGRLFEEFHTLHGQEGGTGLGLAISRRLVQLHGGEIWVESQPGEGSTFAFSLPVAA